MAKEKIQINSNICVAWFDNNSWGDRGDPIVTKLKDVDFGTTPKYPLRGDVVKQKTWKNVFVTLKNKTRKTYYSYLVRVTKQDNKFYVDKELLDQNEILKEILIKE